MGNKIKNFEAFNENVSGKKITILNTKNDQFHYDIYLDDNDTITKIDNQWDVKGLPAYVHMKFDRKLLDHYIKNKRPEFYIDGDN